MTNEHDRWHWFNKWVMSLSQRETVKVFHMLMAGVHFTQYMLQRSRLHIIEREEGELPADETGKTIGATALFDAMNATYKHLNSEEIHYANQFADFLNLQSRGHYFVCDKCKVKSDIMLNLPKATINRLRHNRAALISLFQTENAGMILKLHGEEVTSIIRFMATHDKCEVNVGESTYNAIMSIKSNACPESPIT